MIIGYFVAPLVILALWNSPFSLVVAGLLLPVPMTIDGLRQMFTEYWSTNPVRLLTGGLAGTGQIVLLTGLTRVAVAL